MLYDEQLKEANASYLRLVCERNALRQAMVNAMTRLNTGLRYGADLHSSSLVVIEDVISLINDALYKE